jgi:dihydroorotate dehydrogenase
MLYKHVLKPVLFKFNPENVHNFFVDAGEILGKSSVGQGLVGAAYGYRGADISKIVDGNIYQTPVILSAGFDYNARLVNILPSISFGGVEVGSVTARECAGNPKPRLKRLPRSKSLLVNKGLKNDSVDHIIKRLKKARRKEGFVLGVSIARTNDPCSSSTEEGIADYLYSFKRFNEESIGDYYTINISCPNAFGGEAFTDPARLKALMQALEEVETTRPVYVKLPINLSWDEIRALTDVLKEFRVRGVVIGNLNKDYSKLHPEEAPAEYRGGTSGKPCRDLSTELTRLIKGHYGSRFTIISCGGIMSPADALEKFNAGADLVQLITGMIYEGPGLINSICKSYSENFRSTSMSSER